MRKGVTGRSGHSPFIPATAIAVATALLAGPVVAQESQPQARPSAQTQPSQTQPSAPEQERVEVGQPAPDFSLPGTDGETYTLSDLRGEKPVVLVFFRGTW